jgi:transporter family-2 protein
MNNSIWIFVALLSGAFLPIQAGLNTKLGKTLDSPLYAALASFLVGTIGIIAYILITRQTVSWSGIKDAPAYTWLGGLLGAFYITVIVLVFPKLGPGLTFGLIVGGQMVVSIILEHFNVLVTQQNPVNMMKIIGVILVVAGVIIIRKY